MRTSFFIVVITTLFSFLGINANAQKIDYKPSGTYMFAHRDTCDLFMDVYNATPGSETKYMGKEKPTVIFIFGGGFVGGVRSNPSYLPWFKLLNDNGYKLITIDYRLGLKGVDMKFSITKIFNTAKATRHAVEMGIEDLFSATNYIIENAKTLGVDPSNLVVSGSSAGAMISVAAEQEITNKTKLASVLPKGFNYKGVMSFAGAIVSGEGKPKYKSEPCPQLLIHGDADFTVRYNKLAVLNWGIFGTNVLTQILAKNGYVYNTYRYKDHSHDMASNFVPTWPEQKRFLEVNVTAGERRIVDSYVDDPTMPKWEAATLDSLY